MTTITRGIAAAVLVFLLAGTPARGQPCLCDPAAGPSLSRVSMLAIAGEFEAVAAGVLAVDQGASPATFRKIARLFRRSEEHLRKGLLARTSLTFDKADRYLRKAARDVEKLTGVMAAAQAGGLLQAAPANRLDARLSHLAADVLGLAGSTETCWEHCSDAACQTRDMICGLLAAKGCMCVPTSSFPFPPVVINPD